MDAWCVGIRETHLKALLDRYKFDSARQAADTLSALLDARLPVFPVSAVVVPVPTSPAHRRIRGFDHMALIGRRLAQCRGLTFSEVLATDRTDTQHFKNRAQRQAAAAVGLRIRRPVPDTIVLIDDIYTTGSTLRACVRYLLTHGAQRVFVAVIARQTLDESDDL